MDVWEIESDEGIVIEDSDRSGKQANIDRVLAQREWDKLQSVHGNAGYREGISDARDDAALQAGFDKGYAEAARYGLEWGRLRGILDALQFCALSKKFKMSPLDMERLASIKQEMTRVNWTDLLQPEHSTSKHPYDPEEGARKFHDNVEAALAKYRGQIELHVKEAGLDLELISKRQSTPCLYTLTTAQLFT